MSFVSKISEEQAGPELKPLYEQIREHYGFLPNYFQALGPAPKSSNGIGISRMSFCVPGRSLRRSRNKLWLS